MSIVPCVFSFAGDMPTYSWFFSSRTDKIGGLQSQEIYNDPASSNHGMGMQRSATKARPSSSTSLSAQSQKGFNKRHARFYCIHFLFSEFSLVSDDVPFVGLFSLSPHVEVLPVHLF
jgi:hypothetical protein